MSLGRYGNGARIARMALLGSVLAALAGCVAFPPEGDTGPATGAIAARILWAEPVHPALSLPGGAPGHRWVAPPGVFLVRAAVTATDITTSVGTTFDAVPGSPGSGVVENVPVGSGRTLTLEGLNSSQQTVFRSVTENISVTAGVRTNLGEVTLEVVPGADTTPPGAVTNFSAQRGDGLVNLSWDNPSDDDFAGVIIRRAISGPPESESDGEQIFSGTGTAHSDSGLINGVQYFYSAFAHDPVPNYAAGAQATATPISTGGGGAPGPVSNVVAVAADGQVTLSWDNPTDANFAGVRIQRSTTSAPASSDQGEFIAQVLSPDNSYQDTGVTNDSTYFYSLFAFSDTQEFADGLSVEATPSSGTGDGGTTFHSTDVSLTISDNSTIQSELTVSGGPTSITRITVTVNITHTFTGDLTITLFGPSSTEVTLYDQTGGATEDFNDTVFDDDASTSISSGAGPFEGSYIPEGSLSAFSGESANGTWTLQVEDVATGDTGTLNDWSITIEGDTDSLFLIGGEVIGLNGSVTLQNNNDDDLILAADGFFDFDTELFDGDDYDVSVASQPDDQTCTVSNGSGTVDLADVTDVVVTCATVVTATNTPLTLTDLDTTLATLTVDSGPTSLEKVTVTVTIDHIWVSDLDLYLISPDGTTVLLSSAVGDDGDNYEDTTFDDDADQGITEGLPPFTGVFRPQGSLSDFAGESALGTWTLQVNDTVDLIEGTLQDWSLSLVGTDYGSRTTETVSSTNVPVTLVDTVGSFSDLDASGVASVITKVTVTLNISHTYVGDITISLTSPEGTSIVLADQYGEDGSGYDDTTFDDDADEDIASGAAPFSGTYTPDQALSAFNGEDGNGTWRLDIFDNEVNDEGTLNSWSVTITGQE